LKIKNEEKMREVVIVSAVRTAIGKFGGALSAVPAVQLGASVITGALERSGVRAEQVDKVYMGCVIQAGLGQNPARQAALFAGLPEEVPAVTLNAVCGSGLESVNLAAQAIALGDAEIIVAGGMENMSAAPYVLDKARFGYRMNDSVLKDAMVHDALWDVYGDYHMGMTAENIAEQFKITRQMQDEFAAESQRKCEEARKSKAFEAEIIPITISQKKGDIIVNQDEFPRDGVTVESIAKLRPAFKPDGTVTAANASGINDGAAAVILMSAKKAEELQIRPMARYIAGAMAGVAPSVMGLGAAQAAKKVMEKAKVQVEDLSFIEANEAFASQSIACARLGGWETPEQMAKVNVKGGAIALGHPVGASGCRILVTLLHELKENGGGLGLATLCIGGGMGVAALVEGV